MKITKAELEKQLDKVDIRVIRFIDNYIHLGNKIPAVEIQNKTTGNSCIAIGNWE